VVGHSFWRRDPKQRLTVRDLYKLTLRIWLVVLVGVISTTETLVSLFYVVFRCRLVHCLSKPKSSILFPRRRHNVVHTVKDFV
jgi:hypothetical protein